jgi:hypothetical protein
VRQSAATADAAAKNIEAKAKRLGAKRMRTAYSNATGKTAPIDGPYARGDQI